MLVLFDISYILLGFFFCLFIVHTFFFNIFIVLIYFIKLELTRNVLINVYLLVKISMKTVFINPELSPLPIKNKSPRFSRNSNCITLDSSIANKNHRNPANNHIFFVKLNRDEQHLDKLQYILPEIGKNSTPRYSNFDLSEEDCKKSTAIRRISKPREMMITPQSTFYIYGKDSLLTGLRLYQENSLKINKIKRSQKQRRSFKSELIGQQKTVYRKSFVSRNIRAVKSLHVSASRTKIEMTIQQKPPKQRKIGSHFTPWATITQDDFD